MTTVYIALLNGGQFGWFREHTASLGELGSKKVITIITIIYKQKHCKNEGWWWCYNEWGDISEIFVFTAGVLYEENGEWSLENTSNGISMLSIIVLYICITVNLFEEVGFSKTKPSVRNEEVFFFTEATFILMVYSTIILLFSSTPYNPSSFYQTIDSL